MCMEGRRKGGVERRGKGGEREGPELWDPRLEVALISSVHSQVSSLHTSWLPSRFG